MFIDLKISKYKFVAVKAMPVQISGGEKVNCKTEEREVTFIPTWFSAISDIQLSSFLWDISRVLLIRL